MASSIGGIGGNGSIQGPGDGEKNTEKKGILKTGAHEYSVSTEGDSEQNATKSKVEGASEKKIPLMPPGYKAPYGEDYVKKQAQLFEGRSIMGLKPIDARTGSAPSPTLEDTSGTAQTEGASNGSPVGLVKLRVFLENTKGKLVDLGKSIQEKMDPVSSKMTISPGVKAKMQALLNGVKNLLGKIKEKLQALGQKISQLCSKNKTDNVVEPTVTQLQAVIQELQAKVDTMNAERMLKTNNEENLEQLRGTLERVGEGLDEHTVALG